MSASRLVNRNVVAGSGRTSMRLEPELWEALIEVCQREGQDLHTLIRSVEFSTRNRWTHQRGTRFPVALFSLGRDRGRPRGSRPRHSGGTTGCVGRFHLE